jgi:hypothetical protein
MARVRDEVLVERMTGRQIEIRTYLGEPHD